MNQVPEHYSEESSYEKRLAQTGQHQLEIVGMVYQGTADETFKDSKTGEETTKPIKKFRAILEVLNQSYVDDRDNSTKRFILGMDFNDTFGEASALRKFVVGYTGQAITDKHAKFNPYTMVGWKGWGNLVLNGKGTSVNVKDLVAVQPGSPLAGIPFPPAMTPHFYWNFTSHFDLEKKKTFGDWVNKRIERSDEWKAYLMTQMPAANSPAYAPKTAAPAPAPAGFYWNGSGYVPVPLQSAPPVQQPVQPVISAPAPVNGGVGIQPNAATATPPAFVPPAAPPTQPIPGINAPEGFHQDVNGNWVPNGNDLPF